MFKKILISFFFFVYLYAGPARPCLDPFSTVDWSVFFDELKFEGFCVCKNAKTGLPRIGIPGKIHLIEPIGFIEITNTPWNFPCVGIKLGSDIKGQGMSRGNGSGVKRTAVHYIKYPVFAVIGYLSDSLCQTRFPSSMDFGYIGEVQVGWQNDLFAAFEMPDMLLYGNPIAALAALPDCVASTAGHPINYLYYNAGCVGNIGMSTGFTYGEDPISESMLLSAKIINNLQASGALMKTSDASGLPNTSLDGISMMAGNSMCKPKIYPRIIKSQYMLNLSYPTHWDAQEIGTIALKWALFKNRASTKDDVVMTVWRRRDCCAGIYVYSKNGN